MKMVYAQTAQEWRDYWAKCAQHNRRLSHTATGKERAELRQAARAFLDNARNTEDWV